MAKRARSGSFARRPPRPSLGDARGRRRVRIPKLGKGAYFLDFLEPPRLAEKALTAIIQEPYVQEAYAQGVSTRSLYDP